MAVSNFDEDEILSEFAIRPKYEKIWPNKFFFQMKFEAWKVIKQTKSVDVMQIHL